MPPNWITLNKRSMKKNRMLLLFKKKERALSYHLRRRRSNCTSQVEANTTTATTTTCVTNAPNKTLHHLNLGEKLKEAPKSCAFVANAVPRQKLRPVASLSDNSNSSATGKQPYDVHTHIADPLTPALHHKKLRRNLGATNLNAQCVGASPHPPPPRTLLIRLKNNHLKV
jgi:hypothetical protein